MINKKIFSFFLLLILLRDSLQDGEEFRNILFEELKNKLIQSQVFKDIRQLNEIQQDFMEQISEEPALYFKYKFDTEDFNGDQQVTGIQIFLSDSNDESQQTISTNFDFGRFEDISDNTKIVLDKAIEKFVEKFSSSKSFEEIQKKLFEEENEIQEKHSDNYLSYQYKNRKKEHQQFELIVQVVKEGQNDVIEVELISEYFPRKISTNIQNDTYILKIMEQFVSQIQIQGFAVLDELTRDDGEKQMNQKELQDIALFEEDNFQRGEIVPYGFQLAIQVLQNTKNTVVVISEKNISDQNVIIDEENLEKVNKEDEEIDEEIDQNAYEVKFFNPLSQYNPNLFPALHIINTSENLKLLSRLNKQDFDTQEKKLKYFLNDYSPFEKYLEIEDPETEEEKVELKFLNWTPKIFVEEKTDDENEEDKDNIDKSNFFNIQILKRRKNLFYFEKKLKPVVEEEKIEQKKQESDNLNDQEQISEVQDVVEQNQVIDDEEEVVDRLKRII